MFVDFLLDLFALAAALVEAWAAGAARLFAMGQQARLAVAGRFEPAHYLTRLEELYAQVATERGVDIA